MTTIRPTQGQYYIVQNGDTFPKIAARAGYISSDWPIIRDANQLELKTNNQEDVQPGEKIFIPFDPSVQELENLQSEL